MLTSFKTRWSYLIGTLQCLIENRAAIDYMYGPMAGVGSTIKKRLPKWMDWEVATPLVHTMKNIVNSIKSNQATVEKWMLSQVVEELLELHISMSKGMMHEVVQNQIELIYLTHGEDDKEVCHFSSTWKTHVCKCLRACVYIFCPS